MTAAIATPEPQAVPGVGAVLIEDLASLRDRLGQPGLGMVRAVARPITPTHLLAKWVRAQGCTLLVAGEPEAPSVLLSECVFLPVIAATADLVGESLLGLGKSTRYESDERALFGIRAVPAEISADGAGTVRAAIWVDAATRVLGLKPGAQVECSELIDTYQDGDLLRAAMRGG